MSFVAVAVVGGVGTGLSAIMSASASKKQQKLLDQQKAENKSLFETGANKDYLDTNVAKDAQTRMNETLLETRQQDKAESIIGGGSDEQNLASKTKTNDSYLKGISSLASQGTAYQNQQEAVYRQQNALLNQQQSEIYKEKAESASNLGKNSTGLMTSALTAMPKG